MAFKETVSGVGKNATRTDKNLSERVARVQRDANIQNATGGAYGQRAELTQLAQGAPTQSPMPPVMANGEMTARAGRVFPSVGAFEPTQRPNEDVSAGAATGAGPGQEALMTPVDAPDQTAVYARALYAMFPSPATRRIVDAFEEEGR